jgi:hypothetical protein
MKERIGIGTAMIAGGEAEERMKKSLRNHLRNRPRKNSSS